MTVHVQIELDEETKRRAEERAAALGLTIEHYFAQLIKAGLPSPRHTAKGDVSDIFGLVKDGEPTDIARDKDKLIGDAVWQEYLEETGRK